MIFQLVAQCLRALLSFKKALSLSLSMKVLPILLVFPAHPAPDLIPGNPAADLTPGNLCRYAKGRPRSCKWKSRALLG